MQLREEIESIAKRQPGEFTSEDRSVFEELKRALNRGEVRAAERSAEGKWLVNSWVKQGILLGFRMYEKLERSRAREQLTSVCTKYLRIRKIHYRSENLKVTLERNWISLHISRDPRADRS